jgi:hypothetical protein
MTDTAIKTQVNAINRATEIALKSKEAAKKFLTDAGIIQPEKSQSIQSPKEKK